MNPKQTSKLSKFTNFFITYKEYHHNKSNNIIHLITVPLIAFTIFALFQYIPIRLFFKNTLYEINFCSIFYYYNVIIFLYVDYFAGSLTILWTFTFLVLGKIIYIESIKKNFFDKYFYCLLFLHIISWIVQFIGHGVYEKRAPAVKENVFLFRNPFFFVTVEVLKFFGWKKKEFEIAEEIVVKRIQVFREN